MFAFTCKRIVKITSDEFDGSLVWSYWLSGKSIAILNRSCVFRGMLFSTWINNNFFIIYVEHVSWLGTRLQISLIKTEANREQTSSISALISRTSCKQVYANFCWHWAHCDKELHDDPNKSFAVFYWLLIKSCCLLNRLLAKSTFALKYLFPSISAKFALMLGNKYFSAKVDLARSRLIWDAKQMFADFVL